MIAKINAKERSSNVYSIMEGTVEKLYSFLTNNPIGFSIKILQKRNSYISPGSFCIPRKRLNSPDDRVKNI